MLSFSLSLDLFTYCLDCVAGLILLFVFVFCFLDNFSTQSVPSLNLQSCCCSQHFIAVTSMADSDRSRSPVPGRNRAEPRAPEPAARQELPFFPRWCGPMQAAVWHSTQMSRPQSRPQFRPQFNMPQPGAYSMNPSTSQLLSNSPGLHSIPRFPPAPPASPPPTLPYPIPPRMASPPCSPTLPCPPTQVASPSSPSIPSSQPRHAGTPHMTSPGGHTITDESRTYGFDLNPHWQEDKDHFDNQKINGLTFPRTIRQSAFTQKLDIEGCDPLKLPVAALLYQQANNFWLRKLAHERELYLIPTGDIAAVVFMTELLTQLRNKGVDLDKVSSSKARQDGKLLDKTQNTKYAAQQISDLIHGWVPTRAADPDTQHELTQLRSQLAQLRQQLGDDSATPPATGPTGPSASSPPATPIQAAFMRTSNSPAPPGPPSFDPSSLLVGTTTLNPWLSQHMPPTLAGRAFNKWLKDLPLSEPKKKVLTDNIAKTEEWWENQPSEAIETVTRVAVMMGIPVTLLGKNYDALNLLKTMTAAISLTN